MRSGIACEMSGKGPYSIAHRGACGGRASQSLRRVHESSDGALEHRVGVGRVVPRALALGQTGAHLFEERGPHIAVRRVLDLHQLVQVASAQRRAVVVVEAVRLAPVEGFVDGLMIGGGVSPPEGVEMGLGADE